MKRRILYSVTVAIIAFIVLGVYNPVILIAQDTVQPLPITSASDPSATAVAATLPVTIEVEGYALDFHYNPHSKLLYAVNAEEKVLIIEGTTVVETYDLADGSDSYGSSLGDTPMLSVPSSSRTYIAAHDTDAVTTLAAFDGRKISDSAVLTSTYKLGWESHNNHLFAATGLRGNGSIVVLDGTSVITTITPSISNVSLLLDNPRHGLVYTTQRDGSSTFETRQLLAVNADGVQLNWQPIWGTYSVPSISAENVAGRLAVNTHSGRAYIVGSQPDPSLQISRPVVYIFNGIEASEAISFTETTRTGEVTGVASDPTSTSVYTLLKRCNEGSCDYEVVEFDGETIKSRLPLGEFPKLNIIGTTPASGSLVLIAEYPYTIKLIFLRHGEIVGEHETAPWTYALYGGKGSEQYRYIKFDAASDRFVMVTTWDHRLGDFNYTQTRLHYFENNTLRGINDFPRDFSLVDIELTHTGLWVSGYCSMNLCADDETQLRFFPYVDIQKNWGWIGGHVVDKNGAQSFAAITLFQAYQEIPIAYGQTDNEGNFRIAGLPQGTYALEAKQTNWGSIVPTLIAAKWISVPPGQSAVKLTLRPAIEPVILLPGVAGSKLVGPANIELWPAVVDPTNPLPLVPLDLATRNARHKLLNLKDNPTLAVTATDVLRSYRGFDIYKSLLDYMEDLGYVEYLINGDPARRTPAGCATSEYSLDAPPTLFVMAYDWRLDISATADRLKEYVACVRKFHPTGKVNIIAHSMGGLVARRYILENGDAEIGKIVTIGTPWLGTAQALYVLESGNFMGNWLKNWLMLDSRVMREVIAYAPGAAQLTPGEPYWTTNPPPFYDGVDENGEPIATLSYPRYLEIIDARYPIGNGCNQAQCRVGSISRAFHTTEQDTLTETLNTSYLQIFGQQQRTHTVTAIVRGSERRCSVAYVPGAPQTCWVQALVYPQWGYGDGTVPTSSAQIPRTGYVNLTEFQAYGTDEQVEHGGMLHNSVVLQRVCQFLLNDSSQCTSNVVAANANSPTYPQQDSFGSRYITILGAQDLRITDALGNITTIFDGDIVDGVPGIVLFLAGEDAYVVALPESGEYKITTNSADESMYVEVNQESNQMATQRTRFVDVTMPLRRAVELRLSNSGESILYYDADGNGSAERVIKPTVQVEGQAAQDKTPPVVTIEELDNGIYALQATDNSGVMSIYFSLDGITFTPYAVPIKAPPNARKIYAFADDIVANRSQLIEFVLVRDEIPVDSDLHVFLPAIQK